MISPNGTTFIGTQTVTITSATPGAQIYYTTDGSMPSAKSNPYTMPLTIASGCAIKAIAIKAGMEDSAVTTAYFTLYVPPIVVPGTTPSVASYPITVLNAKNGTVAASHKTAPKGATITLTVAPDKGFVMDGLAVVDGAGAAIKLTDMGGGKFSPDATCTRAQAVTFLYRTSGSPAVSGSAAFTDVAADAYYAAAVAWAEKNGITGGIGGGLFGSGNNCTRSQIVAFLWRDMTE